jgi:hypothetical protein
VNRVKVSVIGVLSACQSGKYCKRLEELVASFFMDEVVEAGAIRL